MMSSFARDVKVLRFDVLNGARLRVADGWNERGRSIDVYMIDLGLKFGVGVLFDRNVSDYSFSRTIRKLGRRYDRSLNSAKLTSS